MRIFIETNSEWRKSHMKKFVCILLVLVMMFALTSFAFAKDAVISPEKDNTDVNPDDSKASPQTGETGTIYWVITALIVAVGALLFCGKKLVCSK